MNECAKQAGNPPKGAVRPMRVLLAMLAMSGLAAVAACNKSEAAGAPPERPAPPVTVAVAVAKDVPVYLDEIGHTMASEVVNLQSQVSGQIVERRFKDGDDLHAGQVLFLLDSRMFQAKVAQAEANLELAKAQLELAQADSTRVTNAPRGAVSQEDLDTKRGALDSAKAQTKVSQAALDTANLDLSYCTITSPMDGRAGQRMVDAGNMAKLNDTTLLTIQKLTPVYVDFTITERDLPEVRERMAAGVLKAQVTLPERPEQIKEGTLTFLDTSVQPGAGRIRLRATLENKDLYFWAGQFVNVRLVLKTIPNAVLIPYQCVQIGQQGPYVYVVGADSSAVQHPVSIGQRQGAQVVVETGLTVGDKVIQTGQMSVTPNGKVRVVPAATETGPGAAMGATVPATAPAGAATAEPEKGAGGGGAR